MKAAFSPPSSARLSSSLFKGPSLRLSRICCFFKQLPIHGRILNPVKRIGEVTSLS